MIISFCAIVIFSAGLIPFIGILSSSQNTKEYYEDYLYETYNLRFEPNSTLTLIMSKMEEGDIRSVEDVLISSDCDEAEKEIYRYNLYVSRVDNSISIYGEDGEPFLLCPQP